MLTAGMIKRCLQAASIVWSPIISETTLRKAWPSYFGPSTDRPASIQPNLGRGQPEKMSRPDRAFERADTILASLLRKARFWEKHADQSFNDRQRAMIERLFEGFEGKLTSSKWALLTKSSQDTALRDIDDLVAKGVLTKDAAGGRSTSYSLIDADSANR